MKKILYSRKFWTPLILAITGFIAIVLYKHYEFLLINWFDTLTISFGLIGLLSTLYTYWKKFNLFVTRLWIILSNSSAIWNVTANYQGDFSIDQYRKIIEHFRTHKDVTEFDIRSNTITRMNLNGINYVFEYVDISDSNFANEMMGEINCYITDFNSSYDHSMQILDNDIIPNLRLIENISKANEKKFSFKVSFKNKNPFIKLIVQNVNQKSINDIWYSIREETKVGRRDVKITKRSIECTTTDITDFQKSSMNYISLVGD